MTIEQTYDLCCSTAVDLLREMEADNLHGVERGLDSLRQNLESRESPDPADVRGLTLLRLEQLEAIDGVVTEMTGVVRHLKQIHRKQRDRLTIAGELLRHLTAQRVAAMRG